MDCRVGGPAVGDGGAIGFPCAEDSPRLFGQLSSFAFIYEGFEAIGAVTWELAATRAFVQAHAAHRMALYYEGEEYRAAPGEGAVARAPESVFSFEDTGFVRGFFEVTCGGCGAAFRESSPARYRVLGRHVISRGDWRVFERRVRLVDALNFHRVGGLLDWYGEQARLASFLEVHGRHAPVAHVVDEEEWQTPSLSPTGRRPEPLPRRSWLPAAGHVSHHADLSPPLRLLFRHGESSHYRRAPVGGSDRVFAVTGWDRQDLVALDPGGGVLWSRSVHTESGFGGPLCVTREGLVLVETEELAGRPLTTRLRTTISMLEPETGRVIWSRPTRFKPAAWVPESNLFIGIEPLFEPDRRDTVARVSIEEGLPVSWDTTRPASGANRFGWIVALAGDRLFTVSSDEIVALDATNGHSVWQAPLATLGRRWADFAACLAAERDRVVFSVLGGTAGFDAADGRLVWQATGPGASGPWMVCDGRLYSVGGAFRVIDVPSGVTILEGAADPEPNPPPPPPQYTGLPVVTETHVFVTDGMAGRLWALERGSGRPVWMHRPPGGAYCERPVVAGGRLFLQSRTGLLCYGPA